MANEPVQLRSASLGNIGLDIAKAGTGLVQGLQQERARRREEAMADALLQLKRFEAESGRIGAQASMQRANMPTYGTRPIKSVVQTPEGLRYAFTNPLTRETEITDLEAPESQFVIPTQGPGGELTTAAISRYRPGSPATAVKLPPGQSPRLEAPRIVVTEGGPQGPQISSVQPRTGTSQTVTAPGQPGQAPGTPGEPLQPRAQQFEVEKAQFAANMARAASGMEQVAMASPQAIDEVVKRQNLEAILRSLPVIGAPAGEIVRSGMAIGLSPQAANWLAQFYTFVGFAVPELAGKQMTITEMRQQTSMFVPLLGEPEEARAIKQGNVRFRVQSAIRASGSGWSRIINDPTLQSSIPAEYGGSQQVPAQSPYGYQKWR